MKAPQITELRELEDRADRVELALYEAKAAVVRARIASRALVPCEPASETRWATAKSNPLGSVRGFKCACKSGAFPLFKKAKAVAARWEDVVAWAEGRTLPKREPDARLADEHEDRAELERIGVRLRPAANDARRRAGSGGAR